MFWYKQHPSTGKKESVTKYLKLKYAYKLSAVPLENFVNLMIQNLPKYYTLIYEKFR